MSTEHESWAPVALPEEYFRTPNVARMYDYYLGGKEHAEVDRQAAQQILALTPETQEMTLEGRSFLERAVRFLTAECGVRQFIDIGSGLPTARNVHEIAHEVAPESRVVYVDNDPVTVAHAQALLANNTDHVEVVNADMRDLAGILDAPATRKLIDFDEPVAVLLLLVLHFIQDDEELAGILQSLRDAMPLGSYLIISHINADRRTDVMRRIEELYKQASSPLKLRSREQIEGLFGDWHLVDPGLVYLSQWRPDVDHETAERRAWAGLSGVARKV